MAVAQGIRIIIIISKLSNQSTNKKWERWFFFPENNKKKFFRSPDEVSGNAGWEIICFALYRWGKAFNWVNIWVINY